mgnify:CR=1 FL=1
MWKVGASITIATPIRVTAALGVDDYDVWNLAILLIGPGATEASGIVAIMI